MPCLRWWPVTAMNSSRIRLLSFALVLLGGAPVAISQCDQQFPLCHPAYASTHVAASDFSVTFYLRQLLSLSNVLGEAMRMPR